MRSSLLHRLRPLFLASLVLASAGAARAQSLQELYEAARVYDATYLSAKALADSAQYRLAQIRGQRLPTVALAAGTTYSDVNPPSGVSLSNPTGERRSSTTSNVSVNGRHPLFNRTLDTTIEQAEKQFDVSRAELDAAEQDLIIRVSQAYFDVLAAQDALATARGSKTAITEQLASAKRNFEVGTATITDTREAQARFDLSTAQELAAENDLLTKRIRWCRCACPPSRRPTSSSGCRAPTRSNPPFGAHASGSTSRSSKARRRAPATCPRSTSRPASGRSTRAARARRFPERLPARASACSSACRCSPASRCRTG
jgi:hypothetical protein